jgi:hypothetical protein
VHPQDEFPLYVSNKETPTQRKLLHNVLDLSTVHVARGLEAASGAISEMKSIAVGDRVVLASEINNANNPITLIDSQISLFLKTLSNFNNVVSNIATVCYNTISLLRPVCSSFN